MYVFSGFLVSSFEPHFEPCDMSPGLVLWHGSNPRCFPSHGNANDNNAIQYHSIRSTPRQEADIFRNSWKHVWCGRTSLPMPINRLVISFLGCSRRCTNVSWGSWSGCMFRDSNIRPMRATTDWMDLSGVSRWASNGRCFHGQSLMEMVLLH